MSANNGTATASPVRTQCLELIKAMSPQGIDTADMAEFVGLPLAKLSATVSGAFATKPGEWQYVHRRPIPRDQGYMGPQRFSYYFDKTRVCTETIPPRKTRATKATEERMERQAEAAKERIEERAKAKAAALPPVAELYAKVLHDADGEIILLLGDGRVVKGRCLS